MASLAGLAWNETIEEMTFSAELVPAVQSSWGISISNVAAFAHSRCVLDRQALGAYQILCRAYLCKLLLGPSFFQYRFSPSQMQKRVLL